jgi:hypothetical protein
LPFSGRCAHLSSICTKIETQQTQSQVLASRLGCVTGLDLATHCRLLLYNRPKYTRLWRWGVLYPLYILAEAAIISTDLAELLGSAIALCLLFPSLPLWGGVLLTASDVLILLAIGDPLRGRPVKMFEWVIGALVSISLFVFFVLPDDAHGLLGARLSRYLSACQSSLRKSRPIGPMPSRAIFPQSLSSRKADYIPRLASSAQQ